MAGTSAVTGELFYTNLAVSIALSMAAVALLVIKMPVTSIGAVTSDNLLAQGLRRLRDLGVWRTPDPSADRCLSAGLSGPRPFRGWSLLGVASAASLLAALVMLNRLDAGLLVLPALGYALWETRGLAILLVVGAAWRRSRSGRVLALLRVARAQYGAGGSSTQG